MQRWLAGLAGSAGGWLAVCLAGWLAGLASWLQLAGCCWLAAAMKEVSHARRSRRLADKYAKLGAAPNLYLYAPNLYMCAQCTHIFIYAPNFIFTHPLFIYMHSILHPIFYELNLVVLPISAPNSRKIISLIFTSTYSFLGQ